MIKVLNKIFQTENISIHKIFESKGKIYSFINSYGYHLVRKNKDLFDYVDGLFVDGILLCFFCKIFYNISITRRSFDMTTVARDLFDYITKNNKSIYFVGARQTEIDQSIKKYKLTYPTISIVGYRNGYFETVEEYETEINKILEIKPDFLIVGMGAIKQEEFLVQLKKKDFMGVGFTCGGFIHQTTYNINYFPEWSNKYHLRAFYRLYKEKGTRKRLYNVFLQFPILFMHDYLYFKIHKIKE